jgi:hypothetical protein
MLDSNTGELEASHSPSDLSVDSSPILELIGRFVVIGGSIMRLRRRIVMGWVFAVVSASVALGQARGKAEDALLAADVAWV